MTHFILQVSIADCYFPAAVYPPWLGNYPAPHLPFLHLAHDHGSAISAGMLTAGQLSSLIYGILLSGNLLVFAFISSIKASRTPGLDLTLSRVPVLPRLPLV